MAENPAPSRIGDVDVRYETSLLIGETRPKSSGWASPLLLGLSICAGVGFLAAVFVTVSLPIWAGLGAVSITAWGVRFRLDLGARARRRFILNFATTSLRLDSVTSFWGQPRTQVVHFDGVREVAIYPQGDGREVLTVDCLLAIDSPSIQREVLIANIAATERETAERLLRVLRAAMIGPGSNEPVAADRNR